MSKKNKPVSRPATIAVAPKVITDAAPIRDALHQTCLVIIAVVSVILYVNTFGHGYVLDDDLALSKHPFVSKGLAGITDIFFKPYRENNFGGQLYRPLPLSLFAIEWWVAPNNAGVSHFMNGLWYALTGMAIFAMLREWFRGYNILFPLAATLLFVAHPIHTEVVANVKSRDEILSLLGCVVAFWQWGIYLRTHKTSALVATVLAYFAALLSKEGAVPMIVMFPLIAWVRYNQTLADSLRRALVLLVPMLVYFGLRTMIFSGSTNAAPDIMDNPVIASSGLSERLASGFAVLTKYLQLLVWPNPLSSDYSYTVIPLSSWGEVRTIFGVLFYGGLTAFAIWGLMRRRFLGLCAAGFLGGIFLYSQIPLVIGTMFGERLAYVSSLFFCVAVAYGLAMLLRVDLTSGLLKWAELRGTQRTMLGLVAILLLPMVGKTISRNAVWKDNFTLFTTDSKTYPRSVRLHNGASSELYTRSVADTSLGPDQKMALIREAETHLDSSISIRPTTTAYLNKGNNRMAEKKYDEAIAMYRKSLEILPGYDVTQRNIAMALRERGRIQGEVNRDPDGARVMLLESAKFNPNDAQTWFLIGISYGVQGNNAAAAENFEKAYNMAPSPAYAQNTATAFRNSGNVEKAAYYESKSK